MEHSLRYCHSRRRRLLGQPPNRRPLSDRNRNRDRFIQSKQSKQIRTKFVDGGVSALVLFSLRWRTGTYKQKKVVDAAAAGVLRLSSAFATHDAERRLLARDSNGSQRPAGARMSIDRPLSYVSCPGSPIRSNLTPGLATPPQPTLPQAFCQPVNPARPGRPLGARSSSSARRPLSVTHSLTDRVRPGARAGQLAERRATTTQERVFFTTSNKHVRDDGRGGGGQPRARAPERAPRAARRAARPRGLPDAGRPAAADAAAAGE